MTQTNSPLARSIGLLGVIRWLIAVLAVISVGAAFTTGRVLLGIVGLGFIVLAVALGYRNRHRPW